MKLIVLVEDPNVLDRCIMTYYKALAGRRQELLTELGQIEKELDLVKVIRYTDNADTENTEDSTHDGDGCGVELLADEETEF